MKRQPLQPVKQKRLQPDADVRMQERTAQEMKEGDKREEKGQMAGMAEKEYASQQQRKKRGDKERRGKKVERKGQAGHEGIGEKCGEKGGEDRGRVQKAPKGQARGKEETDGAAGMKRGIVAKLWGRRRSWVPEKVSEVLLDEVSDSENREVYENEKESEDGYPVCGGAADCGGTDCGGNFKRHKRVGVRWACVLLAGCICLFLDNCPSLGIERYVTSRQSTRLQRLVEAGDYQHGLRYLDDIRQGREGDYQYWMFRGVCNAGLEYNRQEAEQDFLRALSLCREPRETYEVKYYLAALLNDLGRYEECRTICLEALSLVKRWKAGARERYEALLNRSDLNRETQKLYEGEMRGDWLKEDAQTERGDTAAMVPVIVPDTALLAVVTPADTTAAAGKTADSGEDLVALEASAREMIKNMERQGKQVSELDLVLPPYEEVEKRREEKKVKLPPPPKKPKESEADRIRWVRDMKLVIGKDTLVIVQGNDSLVAVVKRIAKVEREAGGGLVYVIPDDELIEVDGLEKLLDKQVSVMIYEVFDFNKVYMNTRGQQFMDKLTELLSKRRDIELEISVHCDGVGTKEVNYRVAQLRMVGIRDKMKKNDLPVGRIHFEVCGSDRPREITARESDKYPFLHVGDVLTMDFLHGLQAEQRRVGHMLNRRVEIRKVN